MKKWSFKRIRFRSVNLDEIDDRLLLVNLYATQLATLLIGSVFVLFQGRPFATIFRSFHPAQDLLWAAAFAALVLAGDLAVSRFVPEDVADDGGVNERLFRNRPLWHIAVMTMIVAICEEWLFRGAVQYWLGPYWTSIVFATIHVRYLRHWLMTGLVFGISYGLGWIYLQTGSLLTPIAAHFIIDLALGLILRFRRDDGK